MASGAGRQVVAVHRSRSSLPAMVAEGVRQEAREVAGQDGGVLPRGGWLSPAVRVT